MWLVTLNYNTVSICLSSSLPVVVSSETGLVIHGDFSLLVQRLGVVPVSMERTFQVPKSKITQAVTPRL